ncbi:MAG: hypothetical protein FJZ64_01325 [Chlamydiae bacterium]|nr:hypothetical protein [Chlamydiota bacterium]
MKRYSPSQISQEISPLHFPYGTWIYLTEGPKTAMAYFNSVIETPHPPTTALPSYFLTGRIDQKKEKTFWWEKQELSRQLDLFDQATGEKKSGKNHAENPESQILAGVT